ncbi:MAG: cytochrome c3 family protein [Syntrophobacteraceae bacterium]|nr:cytochrome c3 family protein [Syntrophobacteraceae bacterium]
MRYLYFVLIVLICALCSQTAMSQDDRFLLDHKDLGKHQRPLVEFNHKLHSQDIPLDCVRCHHDFDKNKNNKGGEGQPCDSCHKRKASKKIVSLKDAFHEQCTGCHKSMNKGPVTCGGCHRRK